MRRNPAAASRAMRRQAETEKKILRDVFEKDDIWFRTGDLMRKDARGYFYFVDRIGDTFRWKGENVSTTEVAEAIEHLPRRARRQCLRRQRSRPRRPRRHGRDRGRRQSAISRRCASTLRQRLPDYARPVFLRIRQDIEITATFKQKKIDLVKRGLRSRGDRRSDLLQRSGRQGVRAHRRSRSTSGSVRGEMRL